MNPYQQSGFPQQQYLNTGFNNNANQPFGNPGVPMTGFPQPQFGNPNIGFSQAPQGFPQPGNHYQTCPQPATQIPIQGFQPINQAQCVYGGPPSGSMCYAGNSNPSGMSNPPKNTPKFKPTVKPVVPFDPRSDAGALHKAMKGFGTNEKAIIQIMTKRTNEQRLTIAKEYRTLFGQDLVSALISETSGNFKDLLVALMTHLPRYRALELHHAIAGVGTDEDTLIEIMCSMSNEEMNATKSAYSAIYGKLLEKDLSDDTSGNFKKLLVALCQANRAEGVAVNQVQAREDAQKLREAGVKRIGTDESVFIQIMCTRSYAQLVAIFEEYQNAAGHDIDHAIKKEFSGDIEKGLRALVKIARNKAVFFAERLYKSMKGMGTNDRQLIRLMVTRCEVDLGDVADLFKDKYGKTLQSWIEGDCSGYYKKCLLGLLGSF